MGNEAIYQLTAWVVTLGPGCAVVFFVVRNELSKSNKRKALENELSSLKTKQRRLMVEVEAVYLHCKQNKQILYHTDIEKSVVICGNGHRHTHKSFQYAYGNTMDVGIESSVVAKRTTSTSTTSVSNSVVSTTEYDGETFVPQFSYSASSKIVTKRGCPTCKTELARFENSSLHNYVKCKNNYDFVVSHWILRNVPCPLCDSREIKAWSEIRRQIINIEHQIEHSS